MRKILPFIFLFVFINNIFAQTDTIRFMHYNLLNYPTSTSYQIKNSQLIPIVSYIKPDLFEVNEMNNASIYADNILNNVLKTGANLGNYKRATYTNSANSSVVNMLFYNADKFTLYSEHVITHSLRDINVYKLYYNDQAKLTAGDTIFVTVISVHFKAGSGSSEQNIRAGQATAIMNYLNTLSNPGNIILGGDLNLYTSGETAYSNLLNHTNTAIEFNDPINKPGAWNNSSSFANIHTQSTRSSSSSDGGSSGGMDDRFDFILCNDAVISGTDDIQYVSGTYKAVGQDGQHFNLSVNSSPQNTSVPSDVLGALAGMSDHLPVIADFKINGQAISKDKEIVADNFYLVNPFDTELKISAKTYARVQTVILTDMLGKVILKKSYNNESTIEIDTKSLGKGVYFCKIINNKQQVQTIKCLKVE